MITVYYAKTLPILEEGLFLPYLGKLEERRRNKILGIRNNGSRMQSLSAGFLLHDALCKWLGFTGGECVDKPFSVDYGREGKPYLKEYADTYFNLSHSGEYVCCAVANMPVGMDVQKIGIVREGIARRFFTNEDNRKLSGCSGEMQRKLFFRMWSIKESYVKLTGKGIASGLDTFEIDWEEGRIIGKGEKLSIAYFMELDILSQYCVSVCMWEPLREVEWTEVELREQLCGRMSVGHDSSGTLRLAVNNQQFEREGAAWCKDKIFPQNSQL